MWIITKYIHNFYLWNFWSNWSHFHSEEASKILVGKGVKKSCDYLKHYMTRSKFSKNPRFFPLIFLTILLQSRHSHLVPHQQIRSIERYWALQLQRDFDFADQELVVCIVWYDYFQSSPNVEKAAAPIPWNSWKFEKHWAVVLWIGEKDKIINFLFSTKKLHELSYC